MIRDGRLATVRMSKLSMRTALPNLFEAESFENPHNFARLENRKPSHIIYTVTVCVPINSASNFGSPSSNSI
jgi:hypothetical protein